MENEEKEKKPSAWKQLFKAVCYLVALVGMQNLVAFVMMVVWSVQIVAENAAAGTEMAQEELSVILTQKMNENMNFLVALYVPFLILFYAIFFAIRKKNLFKEAGLQKFSASYLPAMLLITLGMFLMANCGLNLLPHAWIEAYGESSSQLFNMEVIPLMFLSNVICAPIGEEIALRGLVYSRLKKGFPVWASILISSLFFGLIHGQVLWTVYTFLLGVVFALVAERTGSTVASWVLHMLFNLGGTVFSILGGTLPLLVFYVGTALGVLIFGAGLYLFYRRPKNA